MQVVPKASLPPTLADMEAADRAWEIANRAVTIPDISIYDEFTWEWTVVRSCAIAGGCV